MHYLDEGSGPVILCLHGNPTWSFFFRNVIRDLKDSFRVIAPDMLGCGLSDRTPGVKFRAIDRINHMNEFVHALGLKKFSVLMHDWGGPLGTGMILNNLEKVDRVIYLNTTLTETESLPGFIRLAAAKVVGKFLTRHTASFIKTMIKWGAAKKLTPDVSDMYLFPYTTRPRRDAIWDFVADIPFDSDHPTYNVMMELASGLPKIAEKPVKIIWGLKDPCFHREMLSKVAAHFPKGEILEIPDASHLVLDDAPTVAIPAIREFFERTGEGPSAVISQSATHAYGSHEVVDRESGRGHVMYEAVMAFAESSPTIPAVITPRWVRDPINGSALHYANITFGELAKSVNQYQRGLNELGLAPGDRVLMLVTPGADFLALSLAVMGRGATPVFVDPGIGLERLSRCIQDADPHAFIGSPRAQLLRFLRRSLFHRIKFHLTASEWSFTGGHSLSYLKRFANAPLPSVPLPMLRPDGHLRAHDAALIAFTSGATGTPKGVVFTNEMIEEQLRIIRTVLGQEPGGSDLTLLPIFSLYNVALGVTSVFPVMPVGRPLALDPAQVVRLITDLAIQSSFGSPTLWTKIAEYAVRTGVTLNTIKRIFMAGAAVPQSTLDVVKRVVPNGEASTPYGATEALPVTFITATQRATVPKTAAATGEVGTLVGRSVSGVDILIVESSNDQFKSAADFKPLPVGHIGEVLVRGKGVSPEYLHRPDANRVGKVVDGATFWHRMGDLGYLDQAGYLYYCGRKSHSVYALSRAFHSVPIEELFNSLGTVRRTALVGIRNGKEPALVVEPKPQFWPETIEQQERFTRDLQEIAARSELTNDIQHFFFHKSFPVDARHNAKIFRDQLSEWADKMLSLKRAA
jgi:acyl-CoA synthetase (AMP-forming)/AMP-acid ligase II/pimeloyl-ACP methyl ester carboxylesterase